MRPENSNASVVLCTYNEADNIAQVLDGLRAYPVILVDSSSPDGTAAIARRFGHVRVIEQANHGIAAVYRTALRFGLGTDANYIVQMDAGGTHDPALIPAMLIHAQDWRAGLVIGSRFYHATPLLSYRTLISHAAAWLMRRRGVAVRDATSGFRVWRHDVLRHVLAQPQRARGFAFQLELLWYAHRAGAVVAEYPIPYRLTNSSFQWGMVAEALQIVWGLS